jgi:hypothetical protein
VSKWFAAHIIMYVEFKGERQTAFPVWENIVLVHADSEEEAFKKAERKGREGEGDEDGSLRWADKAARWVFGGVRKLTLCQDADKRPSDGTEVSYIQLWVRSRSALQKLIESERVGVELRDEFAAQETPLAVRKV